MSNLRKQQFPAQETD